MQEQKDNISLRIDTVAFAAILITLGVYILTITRTFLIPFVIASILFFIFANMSKTIRSIFITREIPLLSRIAGAAATMITIILLTVTIFAGGTIISENVKAIRKKAPKYEKILKKKITYINQRLGTDIRVKTGTEPEEKQEIFDPRRDLDLSRPFYEPVQQIHSMADSLENENTEAGQPRSSGLMGQITEKSPQWLQPHLKKVKLPELGQIAFDNIDLSFLQSLGGFFTDMARSTTMTIIFLLLLILERKSLKQKMRKLAETSGNRGMIHLTEKINRDILEYLKIKSLASLLTGVLSFSVLAISGVDFASFWAILIFCLNFIPTIGSIIAVLFPIGLSIIQFDSILSVLLLSTFLTSIQMAIGNIVEPRFLGRTLNLSPVIIFAFLIIWGKIWGVVGMFLAVPILVVTNIILSNFPQTQAIAVILSGDGTLAASARSDEEELRPEEKLLS
ncbi:MAG: AI-2E family transporter [Fibrobacterota bacterium]